MLQLTLLFLVLEFSPSIRIVSRISAATAKSAAWLSPLISSILFLVLAAILKQIYARYPGHSLQSAYEVFIGRAATKCVMAVYFLWFTIILALYVRYASERLVSTLYPNVDIKVFIVILLIVVGYIVSTGINTLGRMAQIFFAVIFVTYLLTLLALIKDVHVDYVTPISTLDLLPVTFAGINIMGIWGYYALMFIFGDQVTHFNHMNKASIYILIFLCVSSMTLIFFTIGVLGVDLAERSPLGFFLAVKQISLLQVIDRVESVFVGLLIFADITIICVFTLLNLHMLQYIFKLKELQPLKNIYLIFIYIATLAIWENSFELHEFSKNIGLYTNILLCFITPICIFAIGKLRGRV